MPTTFPLYTVQSRANGTTVTAVANPPAGITQFSAAVTGTGYTLPTMHIGVLAYWSPVGTGTPLDALQPCTVDPATDTITCAAHGYANNAQLTFQAGGQGGALPVGLDDRTVYWLINRTTNTFKVSLTRGGAAVDVTTLGVGTWFVTSSTWWFQAGWDSTQSSGGAVNKFGQPVNPSFSPTDTQPTGFYCGVVQVVGGPITFGVDVVVFP